MNFKLSKLKIVAGITYLIIITIGLFFLFSFVDLRDLMSYDFIKLNKDVILEYKQNNFLLLIILFFLFSIIWILLLGFATPLLLFAGFVFGTWWGIIIVLTATTIGATLLYILANLFFKEMIETNLAVKFARLKELFMKNDIFYFTFFRFIGGGGTPYAIQNILPILFNMPIKNYFFATFVGSMPSMFVTVSFGSGIESVIDKNEELSILSVIYSPEIYLPIIGFAAILLAAFFFKKKFK